MTLPITLTDQQVSAIALGIEVLCQRLGQTEGAASFQTNLVGLTKSMGDLTNVEAQLREGLANPLQSLLVGSSTVAQVIAALQTASTTGGILEITQVLDSVITDSGKQILWLDIRLSNQDAVQNLAIDLGRVHAAAPDGTFPNDVGLHIKDLSVDGQAGLRGGMRIGVDLTAGLSAAQAVRVAVNDLEAYATIGVTAHDVDARYGIFDLGTSDIGIALNASVRLDLKEGADGL